MTRVIGIDLGTTNCAVSQIDEHGFPVIVPNGLGKKTTPSVICFREGELIIGEEAKELQALGIYPVAAFFKRQMGDEDFIFHANGVDYNATDLSTILLKKLKADTEATLGYPVKDTVITVPAYFKDPERNATIEAGQAAGLNVLLVINEPTSAAVAFGVRKSTADQNILVYDLGGGTFDVSVLEYRDEEIRVRNSVGDHQLGGKNWDERIIEFIAEEFNQEFGVDPLESVESLADLLIEAEETKKRLTTVERTNISLSHEGNRGRYELDRITFERLTSDLMERTMSMTMRALEDIKLTTNDIGGVLLVGGSTRMCMVHDFIAQRFGKAPMSGINVDEAVALGAAIIASEKVSSGENKPPAAPKFGLSRYTRTIDVTNHSMGMIAINSNRSAYLNSIILPKNVAIPCVDERPYQYKTRSRGNNELEIFMTQGESENPADVTYLGLYKVTGIPHIKNSVAVIDISYQYNDSGVVSVEAIERNPKQVLNITVENLPPDIPDRFMRPPEENATEPEHVSAYLIFDVSGSMTGAPLEEAKKAAKGFLSNTDLSHSSVGIMVVSDEVLTKLEATQNAKKIEQAIDNIQACETGGGNRGQPFDELYSLYREEESIKFGIVLADGIWASQQYAISRARNCHQNDIDIIAIGFGSADQKFLDAIASSNEASFFTSMDGLVDTFSTIAQVLAESGGLIMEDTSITRGSDKSKGGLFSRLLK